ncbi:hypothetical protein DFH09DRAFT_1414366 [Mycena vulgaris]|nr:hypothetical protein DFH09DRAFT_1414366 [Mycena vulgaris]
MRLLLPFPHRYAFRSCARARPSIASTSRAGAARPRRDALPSSGEQARARAPRDGNGGWIRGAAGWTTTTSMRGQRVLVLTLHEGALHVARIRWLGERAWGPGTGGVECSRRRGISAGGWYQKSARSVCAVRELEPGSPIRGPRMSASARPLPGKGEERTVARGRDQTKASRWRGVAYRNPACIASLLRLRLDRAAHPSPTRGAAARASAAPAARACSSRRSCIASSPSPSRPSAVHLRVSSPSPHPTGWIWCPPLPLLPPAVRAPPSLLLPPPSDPSSSLPSHTPPSTTVPDLHGRTPTTRPRAAARVVVIVSRAPRSLLLYSRFFSEAPSSSCSASRPHPRRETRAVLFRASTPTIRGARRTLRPPLRRAGHER